MCRQALRATCLYNISIGKSKEISSNACKVKNNWKPNRYIWLHPPSTHRKSWDNWKNRPYSHIQTLKKTITIHKPETRHQDQRCSPHRMGLLKRTWQGPKEHPDGMGILQTPDQKKRTIYPQKIHQNQRRKCIKPNRGQHPNPILVSVIGVNNTKRELTILIIQTTYSV